MFYICIADREGGLAVRAVRWGTGHGQKGRERCWCGVKGACSVPFTLRCIPATVLCRSHCTSCERAAEGKVLRTCLYTVESRAALEEYLTEHSARMRADGMSRFGGKFSAARRVLTVLHRVLPTPA